MASFESPGGLSTLPVELIHAIVHEVNTQTASDQRLRTNTLCTLSCVCRAFYFIILDQLLSVISFSIYVDRQSTQERAATLVRILQREPALLHTIRSMTLLVFKDPVSFESPRLSEISDHSVTELLNLVLQSRSLEKLTIEGHFSDNSFRPTRYLTWNQLRLNPQAIWNGIQANSSIKSLKIVNVHKVPWDLLLPASGSNSNLWRTLTLIDTELAGSTVSFTGGRRYGVSTGVVSQSVGRIEVMTLLGLQLEFLDAIKFHLPTTPTSVSSYSNAFLHFKQLHTLRITMPDNDFAEELLQNFLLGVAKTLETLELRIRHPALAGRNAVYPLSKLKSLKTLKIGLEISDAGNVSRCLPQRIFHGLHFVSTIIASAASSPRLSSIVLNVLVQVTDTRVVSVIGAPPYLNIEQLNWELLDEQIDQPGAFVGLQHISLQIDKYHLSDQFDGTRYQREDTEISLPLLLSRACARPSLRGMDFGLQSIYSFEKMNTLLNRSF